MPRVTHADLHAVVESLNRRLEGAGSSARVSWERRYDYVALDETDVEGLARGTTRRTLATGTSGQVYEAAWHMIRALDLLP